MRGHGDAHKLKVCPLIVHIGWHRGQHSPSGTTSSSPSSQTGRIRQETAEQSGASGIQLGQHWPSGVSGLNPSLHVMLEHSAAWQSRVQVRQHSPLPLVSVYPSRHFGRGHSVSKHPAGTQSGQHFPSSNSCSSPVPQMGQICVAQSIPKPAVRMQKSMHNYALYREKLHGSECICCIGANTCICRYLIRSMSAWFCNIL